MAEQRTLRHYRHIKTGEIVHTFQPPSIYDWERVVWDVFLDKYRTVENAAPRPADEDEALAATPIKGYRQLSALELELTNKIKSVAEDVRLLIEELEAEDKKHLKITDEESPGFSFEVDARWLNIGRTDLQKGFLALVRSVTRPETF